ncbi:MAG: hypothetical protein QM617_04845 [Comamonas sp.]
MATQQLARGLWTGFAPTQDPFHTPNGMAENLRTLDDVFGLYTLLAPQPVDTPLPAAPADGDGQIYVDGTFAVFNAGSWKRYDARPGVKAIMADGSDVYLSTAEGGWLSMRQSSGIDTGLISQGIYLTTASGIAAVQDGQFFGTPSPNSDEFLILWQRVGTEAVEQKRYPTFAAIDAARTEAKAWAVQEVDPVEGENYSAKHYAGLAGADAAATAADAAQAATDRALADQAAEDARASAKASGPIREFYATHAQAVAALARGELVDGDRIEIYVDETLDGANTRYVVEGGVLVFVQNMDQIREDLASSTKGARLVAGVDDATVYPANSLAFTVVTREGSGFVNVNRARPDGGWGSTSAARAALRDLHQSEMAIYYPRGLDVVIDEADPEECIQMLPGQRIQGCGGQYFQGAAAHSKITNVSPGGYGLVYLQYNQSAQASQDIRGMTIIADNAICINDRDAELTNATAIPPVLRFVMQDCYLCPYTLSWNETDIEKYGLQLIKAFDIDVRRNQIRYFDVNLLMQGSDIGEVCNNRLLNGKHFTILDIARGSFGSSAWVHNNDLIGMMEGTDGNPSSGVFIKVSGGQKRYSRNYMEAVNEVKGFVDIGGDSGFPEYGSPTAIVSAIHNGDFDMNRCDGQGYATDFVYRVNAPAAKLRIHHQSTTGTKLAPEQTLLWNVSDALGNRPRVLYSATLMADISIKGTEFGRFDGYESTQQASGDRGELVLTAKGLGALRAPSLNTDNGGLYVGTDGENITLSAATPTDLQVVFIFNQYDEIFAPYSAGAVTVEVVARSTSASGDTLQGRYREPSTSSGLLGTFALTQKFQRFSFVISGSVISQDGNSGFSLQRTTSNGEIQIKSVTYRRGAERVAQVAYSNFTVAAGSTVSQDYTVLNAAVGNNVQLAWSTNISGLVITAAVDSASAVRVTIYNPGATSKTVSAGVLTLLTKDQLSLIGHTA